MLVDSGSTPERGTLITTAVWGFEYQDSIVGLDTPACLGGGVGGEGGRNSRQLGACFASPGATAFVDVPCLRMELLVDRLPASKRVRLISAQLIPVEPD